MFLLSKLLSALTQPLAWVALLLALAWWWLPRRPVAARRTLLAALVLGLAVGWQPLPDALLRALEDQHPPPDGRALEGYAGVVVLGGAMARGDIWSARQQVPLNDAAERMTGAVVLLQQHPSLRLVFTGGEGRLHTTGVTEAAMARAFFEGLGLPPGRIVYEDASRTTYENAVFSAALPGVDKARPWLLLTSAWHMPRAMATFRAAGWNVTAYPVDYRTSAATPWTEYSLVDSARRWQLALHEGLGWAAYAAAGRAR